MLCKVCLHIISNELKRLPRKADIVDELGLDEVSTKGYRRVLSYLNRVKNCYICRSLGSPIKDFRVDFDFDAHSPHKYLTCTIRAISPVRASRTVIRGRFFIHPADKTLYDLATKAIGSRSTGSEECLDLAARWMNNCLSKHRKCNSRQSTKWFPTRLLNVSKPRVRLIKTSDHQPDGPYVTMSHCWGDEKFLVLTSENIGEFEAGIDLTMLPPTFRDAILVTRRLGIRYIWIDCYCIVQDSYSGDHVAEKLTEISQMIKVYTNSILNIGASHGSDPRAGCFVERTTPGPPPECFYAKTSDGGRRRSKSLYHVYYETSYKTLFEVDRFSQHRIFTRGWVLQERLLCSRMLHFGIQEIFWECLELPQGLETFPWGKVSGPQPTPFAIDSEDLSRSKLLRWSQVVEDYTKMQLSHPTEDKLAAIGGVAKLLAERMQDEYIAGLFRKNFEAQLCWQSKGKNSTAEEWRSPSWSWASANGPVQFQSELMNDPKTTNMVAIQDLKVELMDLENQYGAIRSASLVLTGRLIPVMFGMMDLLTRSWMGKHDSGSFVAKIPPRDSNIGVYVDDESWCRTRLFNTRDHIFDVDWYILPIIISFHQEQSRKTMAEAIASPFSFPNEGHIHCLLVEKTSPHTFVRRGCTDCRASSSRSVLQEWPEMDEEVITML